MIKNKSGRLILGPWRPKKAYYKLIRVNFKLSLLGVLMGIFLWPNLAYLSAITPEKLIELTNRERQAAGLDILTANQLLTQAAILKAKAILESNEFKHTINDRKFSSWIKEAGYNYSYTGENLALDFTASEAVMEAWKNSPLHKKNLLSPYYKEIGLSALTGKFQGQAATLVVQIFGAPAGGSRPPLTQASDPLSLSPKITPKAVSLDNRPRVNPENLLTHSIIYKETLPPYADKSNLAIYDFPLVQVNKIIAQSDYYPSFNNFFMTLSLLVFIYLLLYLYYYYFFKIKRLVAA